MPMVSMILAIKISVSLLGVPYHLIGPLEERLIFYLLQDLVHGLSEYSSNYLAIAGRLLLGIIPPWPVVIVPVRPEFPPFLGGELGFFFSLLLLLLIIFYPLILVHSVH